MVQENRLQQAEARQKSRQEFQTMTDIIDRIAPSMLASLQGTDGSPQELNEFIEQTALEFGVDSAILFSKITELQQSGLQFQIQEIQTEQGPRRIRFTFDSSGNLVGRTDLGPSKTARFSAPFVMSATGRLVQQNLDTGEIKELAKLGGGAGDTILPPTPFNIRSGLAELTKNEALDIFTATDNSPTPEWYIANIETEFGQEFSGSELKESWNTMWNDVRDKALEAAEASAGVDLGGLAEAIAEIAAQTE